MAIVATDNFARVVDEFPSIDTGFLLDTRHYIYSKHNTFDVAQYLNYLNILRPYVHSSNYTGMLELGFLPVVMPPSFFEDRLHKLVLPKLTEKGIPFYQRRPISFLGNSYTSDYPDIWVSKMDMAEILNQPPHTILTKTVLEGLL